MKLDRGWTQAGGAAGTPRFAAWVVFAALLLALAFAFDAKIDIFVAAHRVPFLERAARWISLLGDWPVLIGTAVAALAIAWRAGSRYWLHLLAAMMIAASLAGGTANVLRLATARTRPSAKVAAAGWYPAGAERRFGPGSNAYHSFPSGHTAVAGAFFFTLLWAGRWSGTGGVIATLAVAAARVYSRSHHPSDVTASMVIAAVTAWLVWRALEQRDVAGWLLSRSPKSRPRE